MQYLNFIIALILTGCSVVTPDRSKSPIVQEIFHVTEPEIIKAGLTYTPDLSPIERNIIAQKIFLRPVGQERQFLIGQQKFADYSQKLYPLFKELEDIQGINPPETHYDYILINGATVKNMRERVKALVSFIDNKRLIITPQTTLVFLSGDRDLFTPDKEGDLSDTSILGLNPQFQPEENPKTEYEAAKWIWNQAKLPPALRNASILFINAPKIKTIDKSGKIILSRPNTASTLKSWLQTHPKPGTCLCISSQPHIYYQAITAQKLLDSSTAGFTVDGAGYSNLELYDNFAKSIDMVLDNLARTIYTEVK